MSDAELRQYVRKHGRREVLSAILEGLSTYEQAELFREHTRIHPILLAMTGEEFKEMEAAAVLRASCGPVVDTVRSTVWNRHQGYVRSFRADWSVVYRERGAKEVPPGPIEFHNFDLLPIDLPEDHLSTNSPPPPSSPSDRIQDISATSDPTP